MKRKKNFKHYSDARNQNAIVRLRIALGPAGYGIYLMLCERLYETGQPLSADEFDIMAYECHCSKEEVRAVVEDYGLFVCVAEGYVLPEQAAEFLTDAEQGEHHAPAQQQVGQKGNPEPMIAKGRGEQQPEQIVGGSGGYHAAEHQAGARKADNYAVHGEGHKTGQGDGGGPESVGLCLADEVGVGGEQTKECLASQSIDRGEDQSHDAGDG